MKSIIIATDKEHLKSLIDEEIKLNGNECHLNHIDVSSVTDMNFIFSQSEFNGDISYWKPSNLEDVTDMFNACLAPEPYWLNCDNKDQRAKAIESYILAQKLEECLTVQPIATKKRKI